MFFENIPNITAMAMSSIAMIFLIKVSSKIGGIIGKSMKMVVIGIFFSVFLHAAVELASEYVSMSEATLLYTMGALLTVGSAFFIAGGVVALRKLGWR